MEEEFIRNQETLKPMEEKEEVCVQLRSAAVMILLKSNMFILFDQPMEELNFFFSII